MDQKELITKRADSPAELIRQAVTGKADLVQLEKLLSLQEKWEAKEAKKEYHRAMAEFKANPPKIDKDKTVAYKEVKYSHASLANVSTKINTELSKHGLSASWTTQQNGAIQVTCKITHIQGHSEETTLSAAADATGSKNSIQAIGSTITYLERYTLLALTGLATHDADNDGQTSEAEYITDDQAIEIKNLVTDSGIVMAKLLKYLEADKIETILAVNYKKAINAINAHIEKKGQQ